MRHNVGGLDRGLRSAVAVGAVAIGLFRGLRAGKRAAVLGFAVVPFVTALVRYCPLNQILGINTSREEGKASA
jgi:hypothetical protein